MVLAGMAEGGFQDRCLKPLGHPSFAARSNAYTSFRKARTANNGKNWHPFGTRYATHRVQIALIAAAALPSFFWNRWA
jgi:hypothetical protein